MKNDPRNIMPGDRVKVFDSFLFKNDKSTPLSVTMKPATVVCRYGKKERALDQDGFWYYPDLVDVIFDHLPAKYISHAHFTNGVDIL